MKTYIAFIRGINVGGHKKFIKTEQLAMLDGLGYENPQVYLHTGNWVFESSERATKISKNIEAEILKIYGWEVPVLVFNASEIEQILKNCPFSEEKKKQSYFMLLKTNPTDEKITAVERISYPNEAFHITLKCIYYHCPKGYGQAKMSGNFFEKKLDVVATARNYRTMTTLLALTTA